jgi:hypothetical protein
LLVRPGNAGRKEGRVLEILESPSWRLTSPTNAEPGRSVASLAASSVTTKSMRRHASAWAVNESAPKLSFRWPRVSTILKAALSSSLIGRDDGDTGGVADHGTFAIGEPVTWETLIFPREEYRCHGDPATNLRRASVSDAREARPRTSIRRRGRPQARDDRSRAPTEIRESEGRVRATTPGNRVAHGPGRAKATRADTNFRRESCPMHRHRGTCHRNY